MWKKRLFSFQDSVTVEVRNLDRAMDWYKDKLGLRVTSQKSEDYEAFLAYSDDAETGVALVLAPGGTNAGRPPIIFAPKIDAAHEDLSSRGVNVGPIQSDSGGNRFFHFQDLEGNTVEICEET